MSILETVKNLLGIKPVNIGNLNRQATQSPISSPPIPGPRDPLDGIHVSDEYKKIRELLEVGCQVVFVTGNAGTGKSTLIHYLRTVLKKKLVVVAPTGVAALNIRGVTIHSFFKLPWKIHNDEDIKFVYDRKLYQKLELLIIDEVSMVRCDLMDSIDKFLRKNRSSSLPFGGVQLLLIGDLFQLPPVVPREERILLEKKGYSSSYFFSSFSMEKSSLVPVELRSIYRQEDSFFVSLLNSLRIGANTDSVIAEFNSRCFRQRDVPADITLTCTTNQADQINMKELQRITEREHVFMGEIKGRFSLEEDKLPSPINLSLKVGARVMFTKNDDHRRWVNGTLGMVQHIYQDSIFIELVGDRPGSTFEVQRVTWGTYKYAYDAEQDQIVAQKIGGYSQFPLMLAWAVTIHKSQGKTLNNVLVDFGSGAFASGQAYVALSRCRSIEGVHLARPIRKTDIKCDPVISRFYCAMEGMMKVTEGQ